jgi:hypothetical protein
MGNRMKRCFIEGNGSATQRSDSPGILQTFSTGSSIGLADADFGVLAI